MTKTAPSPDNQRIVDALATFGADIGRWPDVAPKAAARRAVLADPEMRRLFGAEASLDSALAAHRADLDRGLADGGGMARVRAAALTRIRNRPAAARAGLNVRRIAAAVLVAGLLGGAVDAFFLPAPQESQIVVADALLYGPETVEFQ